MGMLMYDALVLSRAAHEVSNKNRCLTLGVPTLNFAFEHYRHFATANPGLADVAIVEHQFENAADFFKGLGFKNVSALDISDYEGADIVDDLNDPSLTSRVSGKYDLIYDSGTIEHIFDAPTALRSLASMVNIGGVIVHATPCNGFVDHGFWQVSPDLYRAFYAHAGFKILTMAMFVFADPPYALRVEDNLYRTKGKGRKFIAQMMPEAILVFAAKKESDVTVGSIPLQEYYAEMHAEGHAGAASQFFLEYGDVPGSPPRKPIVARRSLLRRALSKLGMRR